MNRTLLALLIAAAPAVLFAQLPEYVPTENLVGWYPLDGGNAFDLSGNENDGVAENVTLEYDRFGNLNGAVGFQGQNCCGQTDEVLQHILVDGPLLNLGGNYTIACWFTSHNIDKYQQCLFNTVPHTGFVVEYNNEHAPDVTSVGLGPGDAYWNTLYQHGPFSAYNEGQWYHVAFTKENNHYSLYVDGILDWEATYGFAAGFDLDVGMRFGAIGGGHQIMNGAMDDCGIWNRSLGLSEIMGLYMGDPPDYGCMDSQACNFDDTATADDGTCEYGCLYCGEGTVWDSMSSSCVPAVVTGESTEACALMNIQELAQSHLVLQEQLATADSLLEACSGNSMASGSDSWVCGDPLTYWDHDYATVLIGDQCWFAENLRAENYRNGDVIPVVEDDVLWNSSTTGTRRAFENNVMNVPDMGYLYSWNAGNDDRGLCPSGWHVPSKMEFAQIEMALGMSESDALSEGWHGASLNVSERMRSTSWGGSDELGFNVVRAPWHSGIWHTGNAANATQFLTSTLWDSANGLNSTAQCWTVVVTDYTQSNYHADSALPGIFSARCVQDQ